MSLVGWIRRLGPIGAMTRAVEWLVGTEPSREVRGRLVDGARLWGSPDVPSVLPAGLRVVVLRGERVPVGMVLLRHDGGVLGFDREGSRRLAAYVEGGGPTADVVVHAARRLDGTYRLLAVSPPSQASSGRGGARPRHGRLQSTAQSARG